MRNLAATCAVALIACQFIGCNKPQPTSSTDKKAPAPFATPQAAPQQPEKIELSTALISILQNAHRGGSILVRGSCAAERQIADTTSLPASVQAEPLSQALNSISRQYPQISWRDSGAVGVRVSDSSLAAGLLKVRVKEFVLVEDRGPEAALSALWRTPEVITYMANHNVRFARNTARTAPRQRAVVVLQMKNSSVQQIVERILAGTPAAQGSSGKLWLYRECHAGAETLVELRIL
jgi:hypothetical protein